MMDVMDAKISIDKVECDICTFEWSMIIVEGKEVGRNQCPNCKSLLFTVLDAITD